MRDVSDSLQLRLGYASRVIHGSLSSVSRPLMDDDIGAYRGKNPTLMTTFPFLALPGDWI
jgi:hypothetical protein